MRRQLALLSLAVVTLVVVSFLLPVGILIRNQAQARAMRSAERNSESVAAAIAVVGSTNQSSVVTSDSVEAVLVAFGEPDGLSIILPDDMIIGVGAAEAVNLAQARSGEALSARTDGGVEVLAPVLLDAPTGETDAVVVRAFVPDAELSEGVAFAWAMLVGLAMAIVGIAILAADRLGRSVVRPVTELSEAAHRWGAGELDTRVDPSGPHEIAEVGEAFNTLAGRLDALLVAERESVADLSHRLRTPLTALRLQADRLPPSPEVEELRTDIDELESAVDALIQQARSRSIETPTEELVDLGAVVGHRAAFWQVLADEQGRPTALRIDDGVHLVPLTATELGAMVDVLIENVFSHTPVGSGYRLSVRDLPDGSSELVVSDEGPGFADLGVLGRGRSTAGSTGLGLDIVVRTAERTGGGVRVGSSVDGGAEISVVLGGSSDNGSGR